MPKRRHSLWDLNTKDLEVDETWVLNTPRRRFSFDDKTTGFDNLNFGQYDEAGIEKMNLSRHESDSEAEFTDSDEDGFSEHDSESNESNRLAPEFVFLKRIFCSNPNDDLVDWEVFSAGLQQINPDFYITQLVSVFKYVSPHKQPTPFREFVNFFQDPCEDPLTEFHRKQIYSSILSAFKNHKPEPDKAMAVNHEESSDSVDEYADASLETLRQKCQEQNGYIKTLEIELQNEREKNININDRCLHLETKIELLKDGEKLHTHVFLLRAMIRNGENVTSKRLRIMPEGATVRVCELRGNRARIDFPIKGWCSVFAQDGRAILQKLNSDEKMVPTSGIFLDRQESESEILRPSSKRGHEENRDRQEEQMEKVEQLMQRIAALELAIEEVTLSKIRLVQSTSNEIDRLNGLIVE